MSDALVDVNKRLEVEIGIVQEMFVGQRWNAQWLTQKSGVMVVIMGADNVDEMLLGLEVFAAQCAEAGDPVVMACLTVDAYYLSMSVKGMESAGQPTLRPGELQERFEAGDRDVHEALQIMVVSPETEVGAYLPYQRLSQANLADQKVTQAIRWSPVMRAPTEGRVVNAVRKVLR